MDIFDVREKCTDETIEVTQHVLMRFQQRNITYSEIKETIICGEIIEDYPNDYPYPSCLILGKTVAGRILHTVVGLSDTKLWIITAYEPDSSQWSDDFKKRKKAIS